MICKKIFNVGVYFAVMKIPNGGEARKGKPKLIFKAKRRCLPTFHISSFNFLEHT